MSINPDPNNNDLDRALRDLASSTHPRREFTAQLRGELEKAPLPRRGRWPGWAAIRPWLGQAALVALLVGLVLVAGRLTGNLLPDRPMPAAQPGQPTLPPDQTDPTMVPAVDSLPAGTLARLGKGMILSLDAAPDGRLAVGTTAGLCVYDTQGFTAIWCRWKGNAIQTAEFDPTGSSMAVRYSGLPLVEIWDATTGEVRASRVFQAEGETFRRPGGTVISTWGESSVAWEPAASASATSRLAVSAADGSLTLWDWQNDTTGWRAYARGELTGLDWATGPKSESILVMGDSKGVVLLDGSTGEEKHLITVSDLDPQVFFRPAVATSPDGRQMAYTRGKNIILNQLEGYIAPQDSPQAVQFLDAGFYAMQLAFSQDGTQLAASGSGQIAVFNLADGSVKSLLSAHLLGPMAWTPDGRLFYASPDGSLATFGNGQENIISSGHVTTSLFLAWKDNQTLVSAGGEYVREWDTQTASLNKIQLVTVENYTALAGLSANGARSGYLDRDSHGVSLWDVPGNKALPGVNTEIQILSAALSPDGQNMAFFTADGILMVAYISVDDVGQRDLNVAPGVTQVDALSFQPNSSLIAVSYLAGDGPQLEVWNTENGKKIGSIPLSESVTALAWSPNGIMLAVVHGYSIEIWDVQTMQHIQSLGADPKEMLRSDLQPWPFSAAAFSPNSESLAAAGRGVTFYDLSGANQPVTAYGHTAEITALAYRPDGKALASASLDGTILIWDLEAPRPESGGAAPTPTPLPLDYAQAPTAESTATLLPDSTPGAGDLSGYDLSVGTLPSPTGDWIAESLRGEWTMRAPRPEDYNRLTLSRVDASLKWEYEWYSPHGLGEGWPGGFTWTRDEKYVYFYDTGHGDGCGGPVQSHLRRMDLATGMVENVPPFGLLDAPGAVVDGYHQPWFGNLSLSPDASLAATFDKTLYNEGTGKPRLVVVDLNTQETREFPIDPPEWENWDILQAYWSFDVTKIAFTLRSPYPPCGETEYHTVSWLVDLQTGAQKIDISGTNAVQITGWDVDGESLLITEMDGSSWTYNPETGALLKIPSHELEPMQRAQEGLRLYLSYLSMGRQDAGFYKSAAEMYGGEWTGLESKYPAVDPSDRGRLLALACSQRSDVCPPAVRIFNGYSPQDAVFHFTVEFLDPHTGRLLVANGESEFEFTVIPQEDGTYRVLELPPGLR